MKIIECPRDAMQGLQDFVPTALKVEYINKLLKVGFDTIDFGSFVSPKAIPQMRDTADVLAGLNLEDTRSKLLAIVANVKGAELAAGFEETHYLGYPLSLSETFQQRNTNRSIGAAFDDLAEIQDICLADDKTMVVYLSMGFGNPYGDPYELDTVRQYVERLEALEVEIISLADTVGAADAQTIERLLSTLIGQFPHMEIGVHLHANSSDVKEKVKAAYTGGCRRIDGAIRGFGGCPMAEDVLVGNVATEVIIDFLNDREVAMELDHEAFQEALQFSSHIFQTR